MQQKIPWFFSMHGGHSKEFCDHAESGIEDIVIRAIELNMPVYGFSEHAPRKYEKYLYPEEIELKKTPRDLIHNFYAYCKTLDKLQEKYASKITLLKGLEIEVVPPGEYISFNQQLIKEGNIEYVVGSVHWVNEQMTDFSSQTFYKAVETHHGLENLMIAYYQTLKNMVISIKPDIVAHFDLITCFLKPEELPNYSSKLINTIEETLEEVKKNDCILELNTSGLRKPIQRIFPDTFIIQKSAKLGIPFTFADESHNTQQVGYKLEKARELLLNQGITYITRLNKYQQKIIREQITLI
ncbi:MAG: histidinol-phosphatase [Candidatus Hydrogenedens sp.]